METFVVSFPDRPSVKPLEVQGINKRQVWDRYHRMHPFERVEVKKTNNETTVF